MVNNPIKENSYEKKKKKKKQLIFWQIFVSFSIKIISKYS